MAPLLVHPKEELIHPWLGMLLTIGEFGFRIQVLRTNGFLHRINLPDQGQGLSCRLLLHTERIAVRFAYEWHDDIDSWFRSYGNENWEFDENVLIQRRFSSINDLPIREADRNSTGRWGGALTIVRG